MHHFVCVSCIWKRVKGMTEKWITTLQKKDGKFRPALWGSNKKSSSTSRQKNPNHKMKTKLLFMSRHEKSGRVQTFAPCFCKTIPCTAGLVAWAAGCTAEKEHLQSKLKIKTAASGWDHWWDLLIKHEMVKNKWRFWVRKSLTRKSRVWLLLLPHLIMAAKSCS